jgi:drug/metabolite transporter (DMT)-like permease
MNRLVPQQALLASMIGGAVSHKSTPIVLGLVSSLFFSTTFIVNRAIGLAGGHWVWTAVLRYAWVLLFLGGFFVVKGTIGLVLAAFRKHWPFWILAGSIGYGVFYSSLSYASTRAPGWIVACTMQFTILATPIVLLAFGARIRRRGLMLLLLIFAGIVMVNIDHRSAGSTAQMLGVLPVLIAAFAYPIGNQLVQEARSGGRGWIPALTDAITADAAARVLLLTLGSVPFWILVLLLPHSAAPTGQQVIGTGIVALSGTVIGTSIFLMARQSVGRDANAVAKVDATQAGYTAFSMIGEVAFLGGAIPGLLGVAGLVLVLGGLAVYAATAH